MRPLLQHAQRSFSSNASFIASKPSNRTFSNILLSVSSAPSVCLQCQYRASLSFQSSRSRQWPSQVSYRRSIHHPSGDEKPRKDETPEERLARVREDIALRERQEKERQEKERQERERLEKERLEKERQEKERLEREKEEQATPEKKPLPGRIELSSLEASSQLKGEDRSLPDVAELSSSDTLPPPNDVKARKVGVKQEVKTTPAKDDVERVPEDQLPSHHHAQRWDLSKRFQELMDDILPKLAVVTQKVNTYTGTDYSGIEALKREIKEHEKLVKTRRAAIDEAKQALDAALSQQASAQKEVVSLLERKHSWSDRDLERYMSLIRSEHINDQAVREAKEAIKQAENALEEARSQLEKRERAQYHEEQIWSDTIRRNSTWVTFGLMGLNIFLLLATMFVIEPWRRRRMVGEIKNALEAQKTVAEHIPALAAQTVAAAPAAATPTIAPEVEKTVTPVEAVPMSPVATDSVDASPVQQDTAAITEVDAATEPPSITPEFPAEPLQDSLVETAAEEQAVLLSSVDIEQEVRDSPAPMPETWQGKVTYIAKDIISDRTISMRRIDFTAAVLQGAAAGAIITAAIIAMIVGR